MLFVIMGASALPFLPITTLRFMLREERSQEWVKHYVTFM